MMVQLDSNYAVDAEAVRMLTRDCTSQDYTRVIVFIHNNHYIEITVNRKLHEVRELINLAIAQGE